MKFMIQWDIKVKTEKGAVNTYGRIAYVSGDRANEGVFSLWNIRDNILIANLDQVKSRGFLDAKKEKKIAEEWYEKLKFRAEGITSKITSLSGGNQQKGSDCQRYCIWRRYYSVKRSDSRG